MKTEATVFGVVTGSLYLFGAVYGWWTWYDGGSIEYIGTVALLLSGTLTGMIWGFSAFIARRIDPRPEDRGDGEIAEAAGDVGFFSPGSYWPFGLALAVSLTGVGVAYWFTWLLILGFASVIVATAGLLFEYYTGTRRAEQ